MQRVGDGEWRGSADRVDVYVLRFQDDDPDFGDSGFKVRGDLAVHVSGAFRWAEDSDGDVGDEAPVLPELKIAPGEY